MSTIAPFGRLRVAIEKFDKRLTAAQRVEVRFGGPKKPNALSIEIEKAKTLRGIADTLTGIYDTLRYMVCALSTSVLKTRSRRWNHSCFSGLCAMLIRSIRMDGSQRAKEFRGDSMPG